MTTSKESLPTPSVGDVAPDQPAVPGRGVPRTRAGSVWVSLAAAALLVVALLVLLVQNTGAVDVEFLWMTGRTSLGLMLLIAVVAAVLVTLAVGTVRILQLRRLVHRGRRAA